jgi:anti-sigma-K factor RskA
MSALSEKELLELAPLAALGALDGDDQAAFAAALPSQPRLQQELLAFERVVELLPLALPPVRPKPAARERVLLGPVPRAAARPSPLVTWLAATVAVLSLGAALLLREQRDAALQQLRAANERFVALADENQRLTRQLDTSYGVSRMITTPGMRVVRLLGQQAAPDARGSALVDAISGESLLVVARLPKAPAGKAYEVWIIAGAAPIPAGTFQTDAMGQASVRLPPLMQPARVKTFAVSLEDEWGVPAPTGPIVLSGDVP